MMDDLLCLKITAQKGMVNIDSPVISYSNIRDMYKTGAGAGVQLEEELECERESILVLCGIISSRIYELQDKIERGQKK